MKLWLLSRFKIDALESQLSDFLAEDLMLCIQDTNTKVILSDDLKLPEEIKSSDRTLQYVYCVQIDRQKV